MSEKKPRKKRVLSKSKFSPAVQKRAEQAKERAAKKRLKKAIAKRPFQYEDEEAFPEIRVIHQSEFFHKEPVNEIHRLIMKTPHAREYGFKMFGEGGMTFANRVVKPEKMNVEEIIQLSGFLGVNPTWMFLQIIAEYNEILARETENLTNASVRFRKAYWLRNEAKKLKESHGLPSDVLETFSLVCEQGKYTRDAQEKDSQDEQ